MNAAWGGLYDADKVVLCLSEGHKTTANIKSKGAFTVSFADAAHVTEADYVGLESANQVKDKIVKAGLHVSKSEYVDAPVIDEFPLTLDCELLKVSEDGTSSARSSRSAQTRVFWERMERSIPPSFRPFPSIRCIMPI